MEERYRDSGAEQREPKSKAPTQLRVPMFRAGGLQVRFPLGELLHAAIFALMFLGGISQAAAAGGTIRGKVEFKGPDGTVYPVPGATVGIRSVRRNHAPADEAALNRSTDADEEGRFVFQEIPGGCFVLTATKEGLAAEGRETCLLSNGAELVVNLEMTLAEVSSSVQVSAEVENIDTTESSPTGTVSAKTLVNAPSLSEQFDSYLPLLPGVVRGPDGRLNLQGARASQSGSLVNSTNATDPYTGVSAISIPIDVVANVKVLSNPYDAEYGKFAGAVSTVETKVSDFSRPRFIAQNFVPGIKLRGGHVMGLEKFIPRQTISVPIIRNRFAVTQSVEYRFVRSEVKHARLPVLRRDTGSESFDSLTRADFQLGTRQTASLSLSIYPRKLNYFGLDTFTPQESTPDVRQRGYMILFHDQFASRAGSLLETRFSFKTFDVDVKPNSDQAFFRGIETAAGGFFNRQSRDTERFEHSEVYHAQPLSALGQHLIKAGWNFARESYDGRQVFASVHLLGAANQLVQLIEFGPPTSPAVTQRQYTVFFQDKWSLRPRFTLDAGVRFDRNSTARQDHFAPRIGFAAVLDKSNKTVLRGGVGEFYDRVNLNVASFLDLPGRTESRFSGGAVPVSAVTYRHRLSSPVRDPRSVGWNLQIDRHLRSRLYLRAGYQQRITSRNFLVDPETTPGGHFLTLSNNGLDRYRAFEVTARYLVGETGQVTASYVRSSAVGNLNDFNSLFSDTPLSTIRPDERSRLAFDAPHRFLVWAELQLPWKVTFTPLMDVHTGFPYSIVDENRDFVGPRNQAGRFPRFVSVDFQLLRRIRLPIVHKKARIGVRVFDAFNTFNPMDIQNNIASPRFGTFTRSADRIVAGKLIFGGGL